MTDVNVKHAVDLVTGQAEPTDDELAQLRRGDAMLMAVIMTGYTKSGKPIMDQWPGREPPDDAPRGQRKKLRPRQQQIAFLILQGLSRYQICARLDISANTVQTHMRFLREATGETKTWRAAVCAAAWGWLDA